MFSTQMRIIFTVLKQSAMTNFKNAIAEAKEWKLDAYVSNNQLVIKKRGGNQVVARIEADGKISYIASGYSNSIQDIAAKIHGDAEESAKKEVRPVGNSAGFCGTDKRTLNNISRFGYDAIEM